MLPNEHIPPDFAEVQKHIEQMQGPHRMRLLIGHGSGPRRYMPLRTIAIAPWYAWPANRCEISARSQQ